MLDLFILRSVKAISKRLIQAGCWNGKSDQVFKLKYDWPKRNLNCLISVRKDCHVVQLASMMAEECGRKYITYALSF